MASQYPIDYEGLLGKTDTGDFFANLMQATVAAREILTAIDQSQGLLGQLVRANQTGEKPPREELNQSLKNINDASARLAAILDRINRGEGLAGALVADSPRNRWMLRNLDESLAALQASSRRVEQLTASLRNGKGLIPQLMRDREFANDVLADTRKSIHQFEMILNKINSGQRTLGKLLNDPSLYYHAEGALVRRVGTSILQGPLRNHTPVHGSIAARRSKWAGFQSQDHSFPGSAALPTVGNPGPARVGP